MRQINDSKDIKTGLSIIEESVDALEHQRKKWEVEKLKQKESIARLQKVFYSTPTTTNKRDLYVSPEEVGKKKKKF